MNRAPPAHKQVPQTLGDVIKHMVQQEIDFDSDEPLACPVDKEDGETCESCQ